jgi:hypothetical protein
MMFKGNFLLFMMLLFLSFFIPRVSAQIPPVPPPTIDREGTERSWDISHPGWREKRAEAARKKEEARQLRQKKAQDAANKKAAAKERKEQASAEALRQKEERKLEQKRKAEIEAEKRRKDKERKAHALDMMKRFRKATADVDLAAAANSNWDEIMARQNELFAGILSADAISPEEKRKHSLNLPILNRKSASVVRLEAIPPPLPLRQGGLMQDPPMDGDRSQDQDVDFGVPGLDNVSRLVAEVTDTLQSEAISELKDFIIASVQNPRAAIALKGGKIYSDFTLDVLTNTLNDIDNAVDFLSAQQKQSLNFVTSGKAQ